MGRVGPDRVVGAGFVPALGAGIAGVRVPARGTPTSDRAGPSELVALTSAFEVRGSSWAKTTNH